MRLIRILVLSAVLSVPGAPPVGAQSALSSSGYAELSRRVNSQSNLRVQHSGSLTQLPGTALTVDGFRTPGQSWSYSVDVAGTPVIPWHEVLRVDVRGNSAGTGAMVGGIIGLVGGVAVVASFKAVAGGAADTNETGVIGLVAVSGVALAIIGGLIGSTHHHWRTIYTSPTGTTPS